MRLKEVLNRILKEADDQEQDNILEFPNDNITVSIFREQKRLLFAPQHHTSFPKTIRKIFLLLKTNFHIQSMKKLDLGVVEVIFDPREEFEAAIEFIKKQIEDSADIY